MSNRLPNRYFPKIVVVPLNIRSFMILRSREGLTFFNVDKSVIFSNERKYNEAFRDVYFLRIREKTLS